jgi:hypothetical protein
VTASALTRAADDAHRPMRFVRLGAGLVLAGLVAAGAGFLASRGEADRFTLAAVAGAAALGGLAIVVLGVLAMLCARPLEHLYRRGGRVTLARRIIQVGVPAAMFVVVLALAATIANSNQS